MLVRAAQANARIRPHRKRPLPRAQRPTLVSKGYAAALDAALYRARPAIDELVRDLPGLVESARLARRGDASPFRLDAGEGERLRRAIADANSRMQRALDPDDIAGLAERFAQDTSRFQRQQLARQVRAAFGVDAFLRDPTLRDRFDNFVAENVRLVRNIPTEFETSLSSMVSGAVTSARPHPALAADIERRFGVSRSRAQLIARDQVGKAYADLNHMRQRELGIAKFIWRTVGDERVRDGEDGPQDHASLNGETYSYDDPPNTGTGPALPGDDVNCRCYAEPVFDGLLAPEGEEEAKPSSSVSVPATLGEGEEATAAPRRSRGEPELAPDVSYQPRSREWADENLPVTVTGAQRSAIDVYQGGEYGVVNGYLRKTPAGFDQTVPKASRELSNDQTIGETVKQIDAAMAKSKIPEDVLVYRGVVGDMPRLGQKVRDPAYQSTSLDEKVAEGFAGANGYKLEIEVPAGQHAVYVSGVMGGAEAEILLPRGTTLQVVKITGRVVRVRVVSK